MWGKKAPGFMLIFIKIILTCNGAAASGRAGHGTSHTGAKASGSRSEGAERQRVAESGDKFFSVHASLSGE